MFFEAWCGLPVIGAEKKLWISIYYTVIWLIWRTRNRKIFERIDPDWSFLEKQLRLTVGYWIKAWCSELQCIMLDLCQIRDLHLNVDTFNKMPNLRFLKLYTSSHKKSSNVYIPTTLESFSDELRYLEWSGYPLKSLPSTFCAEKLAELHLSNSQVTKLWDGVQDLVNLKKIRLCECKDLVELPDFTKATNLERVDLYSCERLHCLHPSILSIQTLLSLKLHGCKELKSFKGEIHSKSLKYVCLSDCPSLKEFSISSEALVSLNLSHSTLKCLPNELCFLTSLEELWLGGCKQLIELPHNINALSRLKILNLRNCCGLRCLPELPPSIVYLDATNCTSLRTIFGLKAALSLDLGNILFKNCKGLDKHSLYDIMEDACRPFMRATIRTALNYPLHGLSNRCEVCYPGSKVPKWFKYRTRQASITAELDQPYHQLLGVIHCCVVSQAAPSTSEGGHLTVQYRFCIGDGEGGTYSGRWASYGEEGWNEDHVFIWYGCYQIVEGIEIFRGRCTTYNLNISSEFFPSDNFDSSEPKFLVKGCGILPIYVSDILNFTQKVKMKVESDDKPRKYRDLDDLDPNAVKREMMLRTKKELVAQSKKFDLTSFSEQFERRMKQSGSKE